MLWRLHRFKGVPWVVCSGNVGEVGAPSLPDPLLSGSGVLAVVSVSPPGSWRSLLCGWGFGNVVLGGRRGLWEARGWLYFREGGMGGGRRLGGRHLLMEVAPKQMSQIHRSSGSSF